MTIISHSLRCGLKLLGPLPGPPALAVLTLRARVWTWYTIPLVAPMPVSIQNSKIIYQALKSCGVRLMSALPETWLLHLIGLADADPDMILIRLTREEEGIGISAGAHLAGVKSALLMQNHGFLASINAITSLALLYKIPLLMVISYRGHMGEKDPWQTCGGRVTEPVLQALDIPYDLLAEPAQAQRQIAAAQMLAESSLTPVALLLSRQLMWEE